MLIATSSGGGMNVVLIPILILAFGFGPSEAIGTAFFALTIGSVVATVRFFNKGFLDVRRGVILGAASSPGVFVGSYLSYLAEGRVFQAVLGVVVVMLAVLMVLRGRTRAQGTHGSAEAGPEARSTFAYKIDLRLGASLLFLVGVFVGFFGQGGGLVLVPVLQYLGFPIFVTLGTARIIALIAGSSALASHLAVSKVNLVYGVPIAIGAVVGGMLGVEIDAAMKANVLRLAAASLICLLGLALILETLL